MYPHDPDSEISLTLYVLPESRRWKQLREQIGAHRAEFSSLARIEVWASSRAYPGFLDKGVIVSKDNPYNISLDSRKPLLIACRGEFNKAMPLCVTTYRHIN